MSSINDYPELLALQDFVSQHNIVVSKQDVVALDPKLVGVKFTIGNHTMDIHIHDEYDDLQFNNPLLDVVMVLFELVIIDDCEDFLVWCNWQLVDPNNTPLRSYYIDMCKIVETLKAYFPNNQLTAFVSDLDFQLNSGCMQYLRTK